MTTSKSVCEFKICKHSYSYFQVPIKLAQAKTFILEAKCPDTENSCVPVWIV